MRILIAEDDETFGRMMTDALSVEHEVTLCSDGLLALEEARRSPPDLLLLDIGLPRLSGLGLLAELKKDPRLRKVRVVIVTASHFHSIPRESLERDPQVQAIVLKPFDLQALYAALTPRPNKGEKG
jgi:DNA-binding response OmpR family regulator